MPALPRKKLPIGIQSFAKIREGGFYYVDKTPFALKMAESAGYFFLSRPRRFGKSLFLDTLKELFEGNQALFAGLAIHDQWDWTRRFPVIRLSFAGGTFADSADLQEGLQQQLQSIERRFALPARHENVRSRFTDLISSLHEQTGQRVVILVDEYDKPILDNIANRSIAQQIQEDLKNLYSVIKDQDAHIRFAMLTGVSKFAKVSLFSGLNNLKDITLDPHYSALCGYTESDLDGEFASETFGLDRAEIRRWYNGYNWTGEAVYNPFALLQLFDNRRFDNWWFETGTPGFLIKLMAEKGFFTPNLAKLRTGAELISTFDIDRITPEALLFQTGYLTIHKTEQSAAGNWRYTLGYPNREVEVSLNASLLDEFSAHNGQSEH